MKGGDGAGTGDNRGVLRKEAAEEESQYPGAQGDDQRRGKGCVVFLRETEGFFLRRIHLKVHFAGMFHYVLAGQSTGLS